MTLHRATFASASAALLLTAVPAFAQIEDGIVINIMRECAKIDDPTARLACYDNNIRSAGANPRTSIPGQMQVPRGGSAPVAANSPSGFGAEDIRVPRSSQAATGSLNQISARLLNIRAREPGIYAFTLEDGAQWRFAEGVPLSYRVPRAGSTIEISRGSLGSFLMRFDGQMAVPVVRDR